MELLRKATYAIVLIILFSLTFQCSSVKRNFSSKTIPFKVNTISYQEWSAGGDTKGTGMNVFIPIVDKADDVMIDSVFFRNLKGQLVRNYSRYTSVLKNDSPNHTYNISEKDTDYPFELSDSDCAIKYIEKGEIKYLKVSNVIKKEEIYYADGPPLAYQRRREAMIISEESPNIIKPIPMFQPSTTFKVKTIAYQEWYAGIKVGGTGMNVFVPIVNKEDNIEIDSVYFRNLKGQLVENYGRYTAVLKNKSPYYTFKKAEKDQDFPFDLNDNECAISYVEDGEIKYLKVTDLSEKAGTYYEDGPPTTYERSSSTVIVSLDEVYSED